MIIIIINKLIIMRSNFHARNATQLSEFHLYEKVCRVTDAGGKPLRDSEKL